MHLAYRNVIANSPFHISKDFFCCLPINKEWFLYKLAYQTYNIYNICPYSYQVY